MRSPRPNRKLLEVRLTYHLGCLREDATNPDLTALERLALAPEGVGRIHEIRQALAAKEEARQTT